MGAWADEGTTEPHTEAAALRLIYNGSALGLRLMKLSVDVNISDLTYDGRTVFRTAGLAGFFQKSQVTSVGAGARSPDGYAPTHYEHIEFAGRKRRDVRFAFTPDDIAAAVTPPFGSLGEPPATAQQRREAVDPFTMVTRLIAPVSGEAPCDRTIPVFDSRRRYDLVFSTLDRELIRTEAWEGVALKCQVRYVPIAGFDREDLQNGDAYETPIYIWLAPLTDELYALARVRARFDAGLIDLGVRIEATSISIEQPA